MISCNFINLFAMQCYQCNGHRCGGQFAQYRIKYIDPRYRRDHRTGIDLRELNRRPIFSATDCNNIVPLSLLIFLAIL